MFIPFRSDLKSKARKNRNNPTKAESRMWYEILHNKKIGYRFLRQKPIHNFIVDFYCASLKLVVEIDGDSHAEQIEYDTDRTKILDKYGLKVFRYNNSDVLGNLNSVFDDLLQKVKERKRELGLL